MAQVKVKYVGRKKDLKFPASSKYGELDFSKGEARMAPRAAKALIEANPNSFVSPELDALIAKLAEGDPASDAGEEANTPPKDEE